MTGIFATVQGWCSTGYHVTCQFGNWAASTRVGQGVSKVTSPVFNKACEWTPESFKNRSFVYGSGVTFGLLSLNHWRNNTLNHRLDQAAALTNDGAKKGRIQAEKV